MNGLKVVAVVVIVALVGVMIWQYMPVEVETGTAQICIDSHHQGDREISRDTEIRRVPRWKAGTLKIYGQNVICEECQAKIDTEKREDERREREAQERAEREERTSAIRQSIRGRFTNGDFGDNPSYPSDIGAEINLSFEVRNDGSEPMEVRIKLDSDARMRLVTPKESSFSPAADEIYKKVWGDWSNLTGSGLSTGNLNPSGNPYYRPNYFFWPGGSSRAQVVLDGVTPGHNYSIRLLAIAGSQEIVLDAFTLQIRHP